MKKLFIILLSFIVLANTCMAQNNDKAKYIFLFIGDGMGIAHVSLAEAYLADKADKIGSENVSFSNFPYTGFATTYSANKFVTCSSASGTALSTGFKTNNYMVGLAPDSSKLTSITYKLKDKGFKIGITTNVSIDHSTPASFYAHQVKRTAYYEIACELSQTGLDFFAGGDFYYPTGKGKNKPSVYDITRNAGYTIVRGVDQSLSIPKNVNKAVALFSQEGTPANLPYAINRQPGDACQADIVRAAIKFLKEREDKGFFIMSEGGQIDWAAHDSDAASVVKEVLDFSEAVKVAVDFYNQHPNETLIIITADHETGGLALGVTSGGKQGFASLDGQKGSAGTLGKEKGRAICDSINKAAGVGFTTIGHTGVVVPVYAIGAGAQLFTGKMDNTDIPRKIMKAAGFDF